MRLLLYGMQSSGASLVTFFVGQLPNAVVLIDLRAHVLMPTLHDVVPPVIAKCVITTMYDWEQHAQQFQPTATILVLRDPWQNYLSLDRKPYRDEGGPLDHKFRKLQTVFDERQRFDHLLVYDDFVSRPEPTVAALQRKRIPADPCFYTFARSPNEIVAYNAQRSAWCREGYPGRWTFGNLRAGGLDHKQTPKPVPPAIDAHVRHLCPSVCAFFDARREHALKGD